MASETPTTRPAPGFRRGALTALLALSLAPFAHAWEPIPGARIEPIEGPLSAAFEAAAKDAAGGPLWLAWAVPMVDGQGEACCWDGHRGRGCSLVDDHHGLSIGDLADHPAHGPLLVLVRFDQGRPAAVHGYSASCPLRGDGATVRWLDEVPAEASVALFDRLRRDAPRQLSEEILIVVALHRTAGAERLLESIAADPGLRDPLRAQAAFWLGTARAESGYRVLLRLLADSSSPGFRHQLPMAFSQSPVPAALDTLIDLARNDRDREMRKQALFWLGQEAGEKAVGPLQDAIRDDPDVEVKKQAVFAIGQLPNDRGVPLLIDLARNHTLPAVRQQAFFWLGESGDPRALDFIAAILRD